MKLTRRTEESISIAFLDVITCGIGAIILLLMISKPPPKVAPEPVNDPRVAQISTLQRQLFDVQDQASRLEADLAATTPQLRNLEEQAQRLRVALVAAQMSARSGTQAAARDAAELGTLRLAQQSLSEEMKRLQRPRLRSNASLVGGIPIDSEYVIFVIDTSASMRDHVRIKLKQQMREILTVYPHLKGLQILSDGGIYLRPERARQWLADSPDLRNALIEEVADWQAESPSNPKRGIYAAINDFYSPERKISIYVLGDEFDRGSITEVVKYVARVNTRDAQGRPRVRIHAIGFPTRFGQTRETGVRFAALMRQLTRANGGTFVGLNAYR